MEVLILIMNFIGYTLLMFLYVSVVFIIPTYLMAVIATKCITFFLRKFKIYEKDKCDHKNYEHYFKTGNKYYICKDCGKLLGTDFWKVIYKREQEESMKAKQYIENIEIENE